MNAPGHTSGNDVTFRRPERAATLFPAISIGARRARLRADIAVASRVLPVHYPLQSFIAVNPLGGLVEHPFPAALELAGQFYGAPGTLTETWFRTAYDTGRITAADLTAALRELHPDLLTAPSLVVGGRTITASELLRSDLLHSAPAPATHRSRLTRSEQIAPEIADTVDDLTGKWCTAYLGDAGWSMPDRDLGLYSCWRAIARYDGSLPRPVRRLISQLPERADDAILAALDQLGVTQGDWLAYLQTDLTRLPGWAAHARWNSEHPQSAGLPSGGPTLLDYLAMRVSCEALLLRHDGHLPTTGQSNTASKTPTLPLPQEQPANSDDAEIRVGLALAGLGIHHPHAADCDAVGQILQALPAPKRCIIWQQAYEGHYRDRLLAQLTPTAPDGPTGSPEPRRGAARAQVVCCIDARSEGLRRHLESLGPDGAYETLGFAGFFAVGIRFTDLAGGAAQDLCPALISPTTAICETPAAGLAAQSTRRLKGLSYLAASRESFHLAKDNLLSPFTLAEVGGVFAGPVAAARTVAPGAFGKLRRMLYRRAAPPATTALNVSEGFSLAERILYAQVALTTMGLTRDFARLVVLCGHGSITENNPYQAALDCGACGGHSGAPNARTAAALLNDPAVRSELPGLGITIPVDTFFVAAEHDTATDLIVRLDGHLVPAGHQGDVAQLDRDLVTAGRLLANERIVDLPGVGLRARRNPAAAVRHAAARSTDWAQVYPEWGLAGNAAFVIGPRSLSRGLDLGRRAFLHSYDAEVDPDGSALETILTAPLVVAQWISAQYYFSAVAPEVFGAGSKTIHNAVGGLGVLAGHTGDLQLGLPRQSISVGEQLVHEPMRLHALAQAPLERIEEIIARNTVLQELFGNCWISLTARADPTQPWQHYTPSGWRPWVTANP